LGGGLTGFTLEGKAITERWRNARHGGMVLAIHVDTVVPEAVFHAEVDRMTRDVRETHQPMPGTDRALLPGAIEEERFQMHRREGVHYGEMEQEEAHAVSERLGVPLPWD
jgi:LDH2 family malate/lactate/ureidoglycolate dehydrogenase